MNATIKDIQASLEHSHGHLESVVSRLSEEDLDLPTDNDQWSVRDHLAHLVVSEPGLCNTIRGALRGESLVPEDFDLDRWNKRQVERQRGLTLEEIRERLTANRRESLALLAGLSEEDLTREARHASLRMMTVAEFFETTVNHTAEHLSVVERAYERR